MKFAFRVDASFKIATGHVMRCLTLAQKLRDTGHDIFFICRPLQGNLIAYIREVHGFAVSELPLHRQIENIPVHDSAAPSHAAWLETDIDTEISDSIQAIKDLNIDWLVVDHYALDARWHSALRPFCKALMVIDDLGDRTIDADIVLDQNFGSTAEKYGHVPKSTLKLCGTTYALLRQEFTDLRTSSLKRRLCTNTPKKIIVSMGGIDSGNVTIKAIEALSLIPGASHFDVTVVVGSNYPFIDMLRDRAKTLLFKNNIIVGANNMAALLTDADIAIGACGTSTWERCCLGVPTLTGFVADNQRRYAEMLQDAGCVYNAGDLSAMDAKTLAAHLKDFFADHERLKRISDNAAALCDGMGTQRVIDAMHLDENKEHQHALDGTYRR